MSARNPLYFLRGTIAALDSGFYTVDTSLGSWLRVPSMVGRCSANDSVIILLLDPIDRRHPIIISNASAILDDSNLLLAKQFFGLWTCPEALPWQTLRSSLQQPQLKVTVGGTDFHEFIDRVDGPGVQGLGGTNAINDVIGLLLFSLGPASSPTSTILSMMYAVFPSSSSMVASHVMIHEFSLSGPALSPFFVEIEAVRRDISFGQHIRHNGYFFIHQLDEDDLIYTIVTDAGIAALLRSDTGNVVFSPWVSDSHRNGIYSANVASAEQFLVSCAYSELDVNNVSVIVPGGGRLQLYVRNNNLSYQPLPPVEVGSILPGLTGSVFQVEDQKKLFDVTMADPDSNFPNTRWPFLRQGERREWWIFANMNINPDPHFLTVAVSAETASVFVVDDFEPDLSWRFLFSSLVSTASAIHTAASAASMEGAGVFITNPYYNVETTVGYTVPGDPSYADPPYDQGSVQELTLPVTGFQNGYLYTGNQFQAPFIKTGNNYDTQDRFYSANGPSRVPTGVFNNDQSLYLNVCHRPQHWVNGVVLVDDVGPGGPGGDDPLYENEDRWFYWDEKTYFETLGYYLWWLTRIQGPPGTVVYFPPPSFFITIDNVNDPRGNYDPCYPGTPCPTPVGNALIGTVTNISFRRYTLKQHGIYTYEVRHATWITVINTVSRTVKFRHDISKYYVDSPPGVYPSTNPTPQKLEVWKWQPVGSYLWILREDYIDPTPDMDGVQTGGPTGIFLELWTIDSTQLNYVNRVEIHPAADLPMRNYEPAISEWSPTIHVGEDSIGRPYALVATSFRQGGNYTPLISEVYWNGTALIYNDLWNSNDPRPFETLNAVHHNARLYWIGSGIVLVSKSSI